MEEDNGEEEKDGEEDRDLGPRVCTSCLPTSIGVFLRTERCLPLLPPTRMDSKSSRGKGTTASLCLSQIDSSTPTPQATHSPGQGPVLHSAAESPVSIKRPLPATSVGLAYLFISVFCLFALGRLSLNTSINSYSSLFILQTQNMDSYLRRIWYKPGSLRFSFTLLRNISA